MQAMVGRVEMDEKEEGTCEVALLPQVPSDWLEITSKMGAANSCGANNYCGIGFESQLIRAPGMRQARGIIRTQDSA